MVDIGHRCCVVFVSKKEKKSKKLGIVFVYHRVFRTANEQSARTGSLCGLVVYLIYTRSDYQNNEKS